MSEQEIDNELETEAARCEAEMDGKQKPSKAELCQVLNFLTQNPVLADAMRAVNRRPNTIFLWAQQSRAGNPKYLVKWPSKDGADVWFHDAITTARAMQLANFEAALRRDVTMGTPRVLRTQSGETVYEVDHKLVADFEGDADAARALGVKDYPYLHDQRGARVPVIVFDASPAALRIHASRATLPGWNPAETRVVDNKHSGGVLVTRATTQKDSTKVPPPYARERMDAPAVLTPLQQDLQKRLADLRASPDRATARPSRPVDVGNGGNGAGDPVERRTGTTGTTSA